MTLPAASLLLQQFTSPDMAYPVSLHACSYEFDCKKLAIAFSSHKHPLSCELFLDQRDSIQARPVDSE